MEARQSPRFVTQRTAKTGDGIRTTRFDPEGGFSLDSSKNYTMGGGTTE